MGVLNHACKPMLASSISRRKEVSCDWLINENIVCQLLVMSSLSQCVNSECIDWYYVACIILPLLGKLCSFHNKSVKFRMCCLNNSYRWHGDPGAKATSAICIVLTNRHKRNTLLADIGCLDIWYRQYSKPLKYILDTNRSLQWKGRHVDAIFLNVTTFPIQYYGYLKYPCLSCNCDIRTRVCMLCGELRHAIYTQQCL